MITQTSCSELLVDTAIHDPKEAYERLTELMKLCNWESSPPLTIELLELLKFPDVVEGGGSEEDRFQYVERKLLGEPTEAPEIVIYDKDGNRAFLEYGNNGYVETLGYRFDSQCNHGDSGCYPIFKAAIKHLQGELIACDGGSEDSYYEWERSPQAHANRWKK
ncbi:MAG: hypothetical protein KKH61_20125 [Gammaproteobacteria bacterium]|nr:hypothetical protein [Gammaproteobacteria bacterium]